MAIYENLSQFSWKFPFVLVLLFLCIDYDHAIEPKTYHKTFYLAKKIPMVEVYFRKYIELALSEKLKY